MHASEPASSQPIGLSDLQLLAQSESPDLSDAILAFLEQDDPPTRNVPSGALTVSTYKRQIDRRALRYKTKQERRQISREALQRLLTQPELAPPPRLHLAELLTELYERGSPSGRTALLAVIREAPLRLGIWGGLKRIYKLAEQRLDAEIFGALACRVDTEMAGYETRDVGNGTLIYLRRRALRTLKQVGAQLPLLFPQLAVQVLRHYGPRTRFGSCWIAPRLWSGVYSYANTKKKPQELLKSRLFDDAWKLSPDPLMLLLETCEGDAAAFFAIHSLRRDFPEVLRNVTPAWLARLARRPLASAHEFLIDTLQGSPEFHQGKLRALGLHDAVLELLLSPSARARTYAMEYARAHAQDLPNERLLQLLEDGGKDSQAFATAILQGRDAKVLGYVFLGRLLDYDATRAFAEKALGGAFERPELPHSFLIDMLYGSDDQRKWAEKYLKNKYQPSELGVDFWKRVIDDKRHDDESDPVELALEALGKFPVATLGAGWLVDALLRSDLNDTVSDWLKRAEALPGLDVERLKGLMLHSKYRRYALPVLENSKLVRPRDLGLPWLLALARRADETLHNFAHRYLLQHMGPADFSDDGDVEAGTARLFALATAEKEPEPVRQFAQTYLRCHHPGISGEQPEAKSLHLKPQLKRPSYTAERIWPALFDPRPDVRRFAVTITRSELRRWGYHTRVYELADSDAKEVRNIASDALLKAGDAAADAAHTLKVEELDSARIFALTESRKRSTRELGMELIRRHYVRLGGAARLGWLMESPDREVRLFAVRLLWERHRPRHLPPGWKPSTKPATSAAEGVAAPAAETGSEQFADIEALRAFLRRILFGLPPGRSMEPRDDGAPRRHIPASVAKRNVIEIVRDLGEQDEAFARLCAPVLAEFTGSLARTEWQACLAALMRLQKAHPELALSGLFGGTQS